MEFKKEINKLCDYALEHSDEPESFEISDLLNATMIFIHVLRSLAFENFRRQDLSLADASDKSHDIEKRLCELVIDATGLDLHDTFGSALDDEIVESPSDKN